MANKLTGLLGMCRRSGRLIVGFDAVKAVCNDKNAAVFAACDAAERTLKELTFHLQEKPLYRLPLSKDEIAAAIGSQKPVACLATQDEGFSRAFVSAINE